MWKREYDGYSYKPEIRPIFSGFHTFSLTASAKIGPDTNYLSHLCSLRPDFGCNADWLLEQCHKIWLAVRNAGSWKRLFLAWLFSWMIRRRRREGSILLSFLLFYGLMVGKYALICTMEIQKIHMVVHTFSGCALFTEPMWVYRRVESLCKSLTAKAIPIKCFVSHRPPSREGGSVGRAKKKRTNTWLHIKSHV